MEGDKNDEKGTGRSKLGVIVEDDNDNESVRQSKNSRKGRSPRDQ